MEVCLKNFRYHRSKEYTLPGQGLVLISGSSGKGKSSLLNAIVYSFYGNIRRPYTHGTNTCKVELKFQGMKITRTSRPNRLLLTYEGEEYEDLPAQKMIERVVGMDYQEFLVSSYVVQRRSNSVLSMTPLEQVKFIETLAFSNDKHLEYKKKFKEHVKECQQACVRHETEGNLLRTRVEEAERGVPDLENLPALDSLGTIEELEETEGSLKTIISQSDKSFQRLRKELERLREEEKETEESQSKIMEIEIQISSFKQMRSNLGDNREDIDNQEKILREAHNLLSYTKIHQEYILDEAKVKKLESDHMANLRKELKAARDRVIPKKNIAKLKEEKILLAEQQEKYTSKAVEVEKIRTNKQQATEKFESIKKAAGSKSKSAKTLIRTLKKKESQLTSRVSESKSLVDDLTQRVFYQDIESYVYKCPSCSTSLKVKGETLIVESKSKDVTDDCEGLLKKEKITLSDLEVSLTLHQGYIQDLSQIQEHLTLKVPTLKSIDISKISELERQLLETENAQEDVKKFQTEIKGKIFPVGIQELRQNVNIKKKGFPKGFKPKKKLPTLEKEAKKISDHLGDILRTQAERSSLTKEIRSRERELKILKRSHQPKRKLKRRTPAIVEGEITIIQERITDAANRSQELVQTRRYLQHYSNIESINILKTKVKKADSDLKNAEGMLRGASGLQEAGKEAEIKSLEQTIVSINEHAKVYLKRMFEETISIRLESFKLTKSKVMKSRMNVVVEYQGHLYNSFDELSGGEKQKCELAFLLAVNDMIGSQIILLDECLNSLDGEINMEVLMYLKELVGDKLVLVASHEGIEGVFDHVIKI